MLISEIEANVFIMLVLGLMVLVAYLFSSIYSTIDILDWFADLYSCYTHQVTLIFALGCSKAEIESNLRV